MSMGRVLTGVGKGSTGHEHGCGNDRKRRNAGSIGHEYE